MNPCKAMEEDIADHCSQALTVRNADRIIVLEKGEIVEEGDHDTLLKREGVYANLYSLQMGEKSRA